MLQGCCVCPDNHPNQNYLLLLGKVEKQRCVLGTCFNTHNSNDHYIFRKFCASGVSSFGFL